MTGFIDKISRLAAVLFGLCAPASMVQPASAEILQIAGPAFTVHCPCTPLSGDSESIGSVRDFGILESAQGKYYAAVAFPRSGDSICRFSLIYQDNDGDHNVTAQLVRKRIALGSSAFAAANVIAQVRTVGAEAFMRRASTTNIAPRTVNTAEAFYFVEIDFPEDLIEVVGVQIDVRPTCT
jgi:hypothetical protein